MSEVKTIKNVDDEIWAEFKSYAAKNKVNMGTFLKTLVHEHEKARASVWDNILKGEKILSDKEAEGMHKTVRRLRKEWGYRA